MGYTVIDHHHDENEDVYRLTVGVPVYNEVPMTDESGATFTDDDGNLVTEQVLVGHENVEDFLFAADDDRWTGKDAEAIVGEQRELVKAALEERANQQVQAAAAQAAGRAEMPGIGEEL